MISYALAKELKEAGFPQEGMFFYSPVGPMGEDTLLVSAVDFTKGSGHPVETSVEDPESCLAPTLSELIEACGEDFRMLHYTLGDWDAHSHYDDKFGAGHSAEEAVAMLWLALNRK